MRYDSESIQKRKTRHDGIKRIMYLAIIILFYNVILALASVISSTNAPEFLGYKVYNIVSDSMKPAINIGDIIIVKKVEEKEIEAGDIITFNKKGEIITHRIVQIDTKDGKKTYKTKGDNNNIEDSGSIEYSNIIGKKVVQIPHIGEMMYQLSNRIVIVLSIFAMIVLILFTKETDIRRKNRREKKKIEDQKAKYNQEINN